MLTSTNRLHRLQHESATGLGATAGAQILLLARWAYNAAHAFAEAWPLHVRIRVGKPSRKLF